MAQQAEEKQSHSEIFKLYDETGWKVSGNVATGQSGANGIALGSIQISRGRHEWVILFEGQPIHCVDFGISTNESDNIFKKNINRECNNYPVMVSYHCTPKECYQWYNFDGNKQSSKLNANAIKTGDKIRIVLNYNSKKVTFYHNEKLAFTKTDLPTGADKKYRLLIDDDGGKAKADKFTILQSTVHSPRISLKSILSELTRMTQELKVFDKQRLEKMSIDDLAAIKEATAKHEEECKEFEQIYENFNKEVKKLAVLVDKTMNPDIKEYNQWKSEQICRYVLSLENGRFSKYMKEFRKAVISQQIKGSDLPDINANDLLSMGFTIFRDRKDLEKYFNALGGNEGYM